MWDQVPDVVCFESVHVHAVAVHSFSNAVPGAVKEIFSVTRLFNDPARRFVHLPSLQRLPRRNVFANHVRRRIARLPHHAEHPRILLRDFRPKISDPGDVVIYAPGRLLLSPNIHQEQVAFTDRRGGLRCGAVVRIAGMRIDRDVRSFLGPNSRGIEFLQYPALQIEFRQRFFLAHALRGKLKSFAHDPVDGHPGRKMRFQLLGAPARFVFLHQIRRTDHLRAGAAHQFDRPRVHHRHIRNRVFR